MKTKILKSILSELQGIRKALEPKLTTGTAIGQCGHSDTSAYKDWIGNLDDKKPESDQKPRYEICIAPTFPPNNYVIHDYKKDTIVFQGTNEECESYIADQLDGEELKAAQKPKWPESWDNIDIHGDLYTLIASLRDDAYQAFQSFVKLYYLRNAYRGGWKPDYTVNKAKYIIEFRARRPELTHTLSFHKFLAFETREQAEHFLKHHRVLIEQARDLL